MVVLLLYDIEDKCFLKIFKMVFWIFYGMNVVFLLGVILYVFFIWILGLLVILFCFLGRFSRVLVRCCLVRVVVLDSFMMDFWWFIFLVGFIDCFLEGNLLLFFDVFGELFVIIIGMDFFFCWYKLRIVYMFNLFVEIINFFNKIFL